MPITCLIHYLFFLINLLIFHIFPKIWKESYIIPLHKFGNKNEVSNYRGIAKLCSIPKVFEQLLTNQLKFLIRQIISPHQHSFLKYRSVETNLFEFVVKIFDGFGAGLQTDVIYNNNFGTNTRGKA